VFETTLDLRLSAAEPAPIKSSAAAMLSGRHPS
jgi:hypothetical protein